MRPSWKGSITFGLVDIQVQLYAATQQHALSFHLLHKKCLHPIVYHRWCDFCHKEVSWFDIEKGIKLKDGSYFVITPENLKKLKPQKTSNIAIAEFVDIESMDPVLFHEHYYLLPSKNREDSFFLFASALNRMHKVAIGQFVLRDKEYVGAIRSYGDIMLLTTLNYAYEIKKIPTEQELKAPKINTKELKLAEELIKALSQKSFSIAKFKDTFVTQLVKKISKLKKGTLIPEVRHREKTPRSLSTLKALESSLGELKKKKKLKTTVHKKSKRSVTRR